MVQALNDAAMNSGRIVQTRRKEIDQKDMNASLQCRHGLVDQFFDVLTTVLVRR